MARRWTKRRLVIYALQRAIEYEYTYLDAVGGDTEEGRDTQAMIERFRNMLEYVTGNRATLAEMLDDKMMENTKLVSIREVEKMAERGEIQVRKF